MTEISTPPASAAATTAATGAWTTGLFNCFHDIKSCCCVLWCPCFVVGDTAEIVTDGFTDRTTASCLFCLIHSFTGLGFIYSFGFRSRLRQKYLLPAKPCGDCLTHYCCLYCALCQEYRELQNRGWNPQLGYAGNVRIFQASGLSAPSEQSMSNRST